MLSERNTLPGVSEYPSQVGPCRGTCETLGECVEDPELPQLLLLHPHPCNTGAPAAPSSLLGPAAMSPWEGGGHALACVQGPRADALQAGCWWERTRSTARCIACSCSEAPCRHLPSASEETPADAAGLLSRDYRAAAEPALDVSFDLCQLRVAKHMSKSLLPPGRSRAVSQSTLFPWHLTFSAKPAFI